ncbi:adenylate/guanylate cyclase domain-containing protein [Pseudactinotalea sp.]|uniref:adenylate/guanylate cyclase domain-containing protein n=1 Tax=Pseudactinotalea sp. TaxID=1926260 RepID=UPI003B3A9E2F
MSAQGEAETGAAEAATAARRRLTPRFGLGIQSKLLIMLLGVSLVAAGVVGVIGYVNGRESLREAALDQLVTIRELRTEQIEREFASLQRGVLLDSRNASAVEGAMALIEGFSALDGVVLTSEEEATLEAYYADEYVPALEQRTGLDFATESLIPRSTAGRYLQLHYTADRAYDDFDAGLAMNDAGDGSAWSEAAAEYGAYFSGLVETLGYEDALVIDADGNVVFTAYKSVDLGANLHGEPYASSVLTTAYDEAMRTGALDAVLTTDFEGYLPSLNVPTAWVLSPLGTSSSIIGVLAVQVPIEQINDVMTGSHTWADQGLGETGEVYLSGHDGLMRSVSRLLVEHPDDYIETVVANGTPVQTAERIVEVGGTVQLQPVDHEAVQQALQGRTGTASAADYTNAASLVAYAPLQIEGLDWVIVAHIDQAEAFAPVTEFTRNLVLSTLAILLAVCVISLLLAQVFSRPVQRMLEAVRRVAGGDLAVEVPEGSRDEFGDLGSAFNEMAASLRIKQELIDSQREENERLLYALMPETLARRYQEGEETIAEERDNVAVVFAELVGFDEFARTLTSEEETAQLNTLMRGFDEAAEKAGVEKVRTLRGGYLVSSGLSTPRVDNVGRAVEFALHMQTAVERFAAQNQAAVGVRAGVSTGTVTSGLVARTNLAYDLWGEAVSLAYRVGAVSDAPGIYVSQAVRERLPEGTKLREAGSVTSGGQTETIWSVER